MRFESSQRSIHYLFQLSSGRAKLNRVRFESSQESINYHFLLSSVRAKLNRKRFESSQESLWNLFLLSSNRLLIAKLNGVRFESSRSWSIIFSYEFLEHWIIKWSRVWFESPQKSIHFLFLLNSGREKLNWVRFQSSRESIRYLFLLSCQSIGWQNVLEWGLNPH